MAEFQKQMHQLDINEVVDIHLATRRMITSDFVIESCLQELESAIAQTRVLRRSNVYAPVLCAFAILDQIGSCYADKAKAPHPNEGSGIHHALYNFCDLPAMSEEIKAIYAFRNGLIHDGSFTSQSKKTRQWYYFRYDPNMMIPIQMAQIPWDGSAETISDEITTRINMRKFTDLVFVGLSKLRTLNDERKRDLKVKYSRENIIHKFLLWQPIELIFPERRSSI